MSTFPIWSPGTIYLPGAVVAPRTVQPNPTTAVTNPGAESGSLTGWTASGSGTWSASASAPYTGAYRFNWAGTGTNPILTSGTHLTVAVGQVINVTAQINPLSGTLAQGKVCVAFYTVANAFISEVESPASGDVGAGWYTRTASAIAPATTSYAVVRLKASGVGAVVGFDDVAVSYPGGAVTAGLVFRATQAASGTSGSTEPTWPTTLAATVADNDITWTAVNTARVIWQASPIMKSGASEPTWPTTVGQAVADSTVSWETVSRRVEDVNCPNTAAVAILASKVFAVDQDITRYCATARPLDWTSADDAGFLPTGLQQANANDMAVLAPYRSNLAAFNASSFQNWQVDPDPAAMAMLDQMDGIGSTVPEAAQAVANDLFYLSPLGVRSVGISGATENLAAGDVGMPIDPLVQAALTAAAADATIRVASTYYPGAGQYWLSFANYPSASGSTVFVCTLNGGKPKWSRYVYPYAIESFAQLGDDLFIRHGNYVNKVVKGLYTDHNGTTTVSFGGTVQWPHLDMGQPGLSKMLQGLDVVADGTVSVSIGFDQTNLSAFTTPYAIPEDTLPGGFIPLPVLAPSLAVKLTFVAGTAWSCQAVNIYLQDNALGS